MCTLIKAEIKHWHVIRWPALKWLANSYGNTLICRVEEKGLLTAQQMLKILLISSPIFLDTPQLYIFNELMFKLLPITKISTGVGYSSLSSALLRHGFAAPTNVLTSLINTYPSLSSVHDCCGLVTNVPIPESAKSSSLVKCLCPIALMFSGIKLEEVVVP